MGEWTKEDEDFFLTGHWDDYAPPEEFPFKKRPKRFNAYIEGTTKAPKYNSSALVDDMIILCVFAVIVITITFIIF